MESSSEWAHNRLGFSLQLCALRYLGFVPRSMLFPGNAVAYVARQLRVSATDFQKYGSRNPTRTVDTQTIQAYLGFRKAAVHDLRELSQWLLERSLEHDKLIDMASKELIQDDQFKEKSSELLKQIKKAEANVADTNNRSESWRDGLHKTIDVIAHGRERFENGGILEKRDVLLALGSNPTLYDGVIEIEPYEWLLPLEEGLPELNKAIEKVQPQDLQIGNPELEPIRTKWLGR